MCWGLYHAPSRSIAAGAVTFEAPKVTKSACQQTPASLPHRAFTLQIRQNLGPDDFAPLSHPLPVLQQNPNAPASARPTIVLPDFGRSWSADGGNDKS
ncbi:MAG TPA: hypothetical protein VK671_02245 [Mucilaginibacter sp.]|nr:hypothetical protein [Mucilaginibacter sp.]